MKEEFDVFSRFSIKLRKCEEGKCFFLASSGLDFETILDAFSDHTHLRGIVTSRLRERTVIQ